MYLDDISNKDELTGILNRRGFFNKLEEQLADAKLFGKKAVMLATGNHDIRLAYESQTKLLMDKTSEYLGIEIHPLEDPAHSVVKGAAVALKKPELLKNVDYQLRSIKELIVE